MDGIINKISANLIHIAPVPIYRRNLQLDFDLPSFMQFTEELLTEKEIDVPDERHAEELGIDLPKFPSYWATRSRPAIGIWHGVPTNQILDSNHDYVKTIRKKIENCYLDYRRQCGKNLDKFKFEESWIQYYKEADRKVVHNHERYDDIENNEVTVGCLYLSDGNPPDRMPYSGVITFNVRGVDYHFKPYNNLLLLFPSYLLHQVQSFYGTSSRIVINFHIKAINKC